MILHLVLALSLVVAPDPQWEKISSDSPAFLTKDHEIDGDLAIALDWEKRPVWRMMRWTGRTWRTMATPAAFAHAKNAEISRSWAFAGKGTRDTRLADFRDALERSSDQVGGSVGGRGRGRQG
ncbi:hypothetical protein AB0H88_14625 [Nonomuraea sp. NPDC050680]|uniref:hypothetical protein n=1 Tax=Nonomuraea sp. NPDC050680 TaxID=3154630 RepID=UPI0033DB5933